MTTARTAPAVPSLDWPEPGRSDAAAFLLPRRNVRIGDTFYVPRARQDNTARRSFLQSYQFSVQESFFEWVKRRVSEAGEAGKVAVSKAVDRVIDDGRWIGMRVVRKFHLKWHGWSMNPLGCFTPKHDYYLDDFI